MYITGPQPARPSACSERYGLAGGRARSTEHAVDRTRACGEGAGSGAVHRAVHQRRRLTPEGARLRPNERPVSLLRERVGDSDLGERDEPISCQAPPGATSSTFVCTNSSEQLGSLGLAVAADPAERFLIDRVTVEHAEFAEIADWIEEHLEGAGG